MLAGPYIVVVLLLGVGAALKIHRPGPTARALGAMGVPTPAVTTPRPGPPATCGRRDRAVTARATSPRPATRTNLGFAAFVAVALRREVPLSSCGCFGADDTPPTAVHLVFDLSAAGVAGAVALGAGVSPPDGGVATQAAFVLLVALSVYLAFMALTRLPRVLAAARGGSAAS